MIVPQHIFRAIALLLAAVKLDTRTDRAKNVMFGFCVGNKINGVVTSIVL